MHRLILTSHDSWAGSPKVREVFLKLAASLGLDMDRFKSDLDSKAIEVRILQQAASARAAGINSVPAFSMNGKNLVPPPTTFEEFDIAVANAMRQPKRERREPN